MPGRHWRASCGLTYLFNDVLDCFVKNGLQYGKSRGKDHSCESLAALQGGVTVACVRMMSVEELRNGGLWAVFWQVNKQDRLAN